MQLANTLHRRVGEGEFPHPNAGLRGHYDIYESIIIIIMKLLQRFIHYLWL